MAKVYRVLLVEDDPLIVRLYERKLQLDGFAVDLAGNGEAGLAYLKKTRPDIVLMDIMMPKLNGLDALRAITAVPALKGLPVVILTNLGDRPEDVERCKELGAVDYWVKANINVEEISARLKKLIAASKDN